MFSLITSFYALFERCGGQWPIAKNSSSWEEVMCRYFSSSIYYKGLTSLATKAINSQNHYLQIAFTLLNKRWSRNFFRDFLENNKMTCEIQKRPYHCISTNFSFQDQPAVSTITCDAVMLILVRCPFS